MVAAPVLINRTYLEDLAFIPYRQMSLFVQSRFGRGDLLYPPFGARFDRVMGLIRRLLR